jgi:potassium efflux system protein
LTSCRPALLLAPLLALVALAAHAQSGEPAAPAAGETAAVAIPIGEIAAEAEAAELWAKRTEPELVGDLEGRIRALLAAAASEVSRRQASLDAIPAGPAPGRALSSERAGWQELAGRLSGAQDELESAALALERRLREARERSARWTLTFEELRGADVPASVLSQAQEVLADLGSVSRRVEGARNGVLELANRVRMQQRSVDDALERVAAMRAALRSQLLVRDQPPLWSLRPVADARLELRRVAGILGAMGDEIRDYALRHRERVIVQLVMALLLVWAAVRGRPALRRICGDDAAAAGVLAHPVAAGLLAGLAPARAFNPDAPPGFLALFGVLLLAPWLRVLSGALPRSLHAALCWLAVLLLVNIVREIVHSLPLLARLVLLVQLGLGATVVASLRRPRNLPFVATLGGRVGRRALDLWLRVALVAFVAGIPAAVLGYAELAAMLASVPVLGSFTATALIAVVLVLELLLRALVETGVLDGLRLIRMQHARLLRGAGWLLRAVGAGAWLYLLLDFTTLGDPLWPWIDGLLETPIGYGSVSLTPAAMFAFVLALWISWVVARFVGALLDADVFPRLQMPPGIPFALATFVRYGVIFTGFVIALGMVGFSLDRVTILLGALGVGLGFGFQNVVNNFVSGVILLFERPIRVGDRIQLDDLVGDVTRIGMRASRVRTLDGIDLIVPNGDFISSRVANWTLADAARRVTLPVGVAYGTSPLRVIELLGRVARAHPEVLPVPEPEVLFRGFGESSLDFELRVWAESRLLFRVQSDLAVATYDALEQAGITIPFPQRDLHLQSVSDAARSVLAPAARDGGEGGKT